MTWLFTIAANKARDALRRRKQPIDVANLECLFDSQECSLNDVLNAPDHDDRRVDDDMMRDETAATVKQIIARMPKRPREILLLGYFQKLSQAEIAGILGIPVGMVKSRSHTAVVRFAEHWNAVTMYGPAN